MTPIAGFIIAVIAALSGEQRGTYELCPFGVGDARGVRGSHLDSPFPRRQSRMTRGEATVPARRYVYRQPVLPRRDIEAATPDLVRRHTVRQCDLGVRIGRHDQLVQAIEQRPVLTVNLVAIAAHALICDAISASTHTAHFVFPIQRHMTSQAARS